MKKLSFLFMYLCMTSTVLAMESVDYGHFFDLCKRGNIEEVKNFIHENPTFNINYQNEHGTTPLVHAATWGSWELVEFYLTKTKADKMLCDHNGQTVFSKSIYKILGQSSFKKLLEISSLDEINVQCKTICLDRDIHDPTKLQNQKNIDKIIIALKSQDDINKQDWRGMTALHDACVHQVIPLVIKLLERSADLDIRNTISNESCYEIIQNHNLTKNKKAPLFVIREAFNSGPWVPAALINNTLETHFVPDVADYVKQLYVKTKLSDKFFESPKACIWKPVWEDVWAMTKGPELTDEKRYLTRIMLSPQHELTKINIQLTLMDK